MEYVYAALLLHKAGKEISEGSIKKVAEAAGIQADEAAIKNLLTSLKGVDIEKAISEASFAPATVAAKPEEKKEKKEEKEEKKEEMAAEGLAALFG